MQNHGVTIYLSNNNRIDLRDILNVIGKTGKQSTWKVSGVECLGESADTLHQFSDEEKEILGEEFYKIVSDIYQVLNGYFDACKPDENYCWISIRSIRGDEFDIETEDKKLLEKIRNAFKDVRDLVY